MFATRHRDERSRAIVAGCVNVWPSLEQALRVIQSRSAVEALLDGRRDGSGAETAD